MVTKILACSRWVTRRWPPLTRHAVVVPSSGLHTSERARSAVTPQFPQTAQAVVCGGGVIGCSVAYHLALAGWKDVVLLEQGKLTCGTTWHAAGLVGRARGHNAETAIVKYSADLYRQLEDEGYHTGWKQCGSLNLCRTKDRVISYKRGLLKAERFGIEGHFLSPEEVAERYPMLKTDDLQGAYWIPGDGTVNPTDVAMAMSKKARELGVQIVEDCKVKRVVTRNRRVCGVETSEGDIDCQYFVNSSGQWARELGQLSQPSVRVPLHSCEHFYIVTKDMGVDRMFPVVRDYDGFVYMREWSGGLLGGGFEPRGKPVFTNGVPDKFEFQLLPEDWDHFQVLLEELLHRVPSLAEVEVRQMTNGPESFTADGKYILGESPEVRNYYIAAGMNSSGIAAAGGVGKYIAEWMTEGEPSMDFWALDARRFVDLHNNKNFLRDRVAETLGAHSTPAPGVVYQTSRTIRTTPLYTRLVARGAVYTEIMGYERASHYDQSQSCFGMFATTFGPAMQEVMYKTGRNLRTPPMFPRLQKQGAVFGELSCYERPLWFEPTDTDDYPEENIVSDSRGSFGKPEWFEKVRSEYWACREGVCLIDMSTFSKFELRSAGAEVVDFLQLVCSNDVDRPPGTVIHTGMHNHRGGYENDCSVVRMADNRYFMISPTAQQTRSFKWLRDHLPEDGSVQLSDVTSMYTAINVIGPRAQELLGELTDTRLGTQHFMHMTCKEIDVGQASGIKAMRLTHSGEDGWMLYIPSEYALHVYDSLMEAGKVYGVRNAGYYALRALRTEKFFAYWGTDLTPFVTPLECGREYRVKFDQGGFIGYPALLQQRSEGIKKRLVQLLLENHDLETDPWPWGGEPIYRDGKYCGMTTSTAYGFTLDRQVCLGYVQDLDDDTGEPRVLTNPNDFILKKAKFEVDIAGQRFPAKAGIYPPKLASAAIVIDPKAR